MKRGNVELAVGLFLIAGVLALGYLALRLGDVALLGDGTYELRAKFVSISGLREGAFVEVAGVRVGRVSRIDLDVDRYQAEVHLAIDRRVPIQEDAIASIRTSGIIGDKFVKISPGGSERHLEAGMEIVETEPAISLEELISKYIFEGGGREL